MKRRNFLELLGLSGILPFIGKPDEVTLPIEVSPVVQAPQVQSWMGKGSIVYSQFEPPIMGTAYYNPHHSDLYSQYALGQSQLTHGRHIAPVLGGFNDDGGEG